ncbi:hypothetical protein NEOLEDRAFT_1068345 [Neolentinus lepideus HHB14362 ss-1]|uniref:Uncharacterized protein n=1 Tax=Neolentinus lepideus HHB14362 ss-1 TaxID=1314782 RepID=A0A165RN99_9AGAM|nr:hypothetical protein NEOLEDRAFT_1068345 [Neolentinus lepideus HHB14362 ss-1]
MHVSTVIVLFQLSRDIVCRKLGRTVVIVNEVTTLRRHIQGPHYGVYHQWCKKNDFVSKLPKDKKKKETEQKKDQATLDNHVQSAPAQERVLPYSHERFREAAVKWLIATDQPIAALEHPLFLEMIQVASRAKDGVKVPNRKATRAEIIKMFQGQMTLLKSRLNVRPYVLVHCRLCFL